MARSSWLCLMVVCLAVLGCKPQPDQAARPTAEKTRIISTEEPKDKGAAVFDTMAGRGVSAVLGDRYRVAVALDGTVAQAKKSRVAIRLAIAAVDPGKPLPDSLPVAFKAESASLGTREYKFDAVKGTDTEPVEIQRYGDTVVVTIKGVYTPNLPVRTHDIRVSVGVDDKEAKPIDGTLSLQALDLRY